MSGMRLSRICVYLITAARSQSKRGNQIGALKARAHARARARASCVSGADGGCAGAGGLNSESYLAVHVSVWVVVWVSG